MEASHLSLMGGLMMVGLPGPRLDPVARELVTGLKVGGIILFARNIEAPEQVWELTRDLQRLAVDTTGEPLLISVDQEGGPVQRLKEPFTLIPSARDLGESATLQEVEDLARRVGRELALVGVNMNLAPVLDVARGPDCPLWERSYSPDPGRAADYGVAAIRGYLAGGVLPVAKHFPGLGDTVRDSHLELPLAQDPDPARTADLLPFRRAAAQGVPAVMTAHMLAPAWDERPATISPSALQTWLRQKVGFDGVIMTDDLEMGGIACRATVPEASREALAAGADLLLVCNNWQAAQDAARDLARDPDLQPLAITAAARLKALKARIGRTTYDLNAVREYFRSA